MKALMDFGLAFLLLMGSLVIWPFIALAIKMDSKGQVFFTQERVGKNGKIFKLIKFRSMIEDAEKEGPVWPHLNDIRITSVGKVLRLFHLDELPQLINIIRGEMSLVGPRPERPEFEKALRKTIPLFKLRNKVKPGITGWAQVNYPHVASLEDSDKKLEYDLYYIKHRSLWFDLKILAKTITIGKAEKHQKIVNSKW